MEAAGWGMKMCGRTDVTTPVSPGWAGSANAEQFAVVAIHRGDAVADQPHDE